MLTIDWINENVNNYLESRDLDATPINRHNALVKMRVIWVAQGGRQNPLTAKKIIAVDREIARLAKSIYR